MRYNHIVTVKTGDETIGYLVRYERVTRNNFGGSNTWECIDFIPNGNIEAVNITAKSTIKDDLALYRQKPRTTFHLGARDGVEQKIAFVDMTNFVYISDFYFVQDIDALRKVIGKVNLYWGGEYHSVVSANLIISDDVIYVRENGFAWMFTPDNVECRPCNDAKDLQSIFDDPTDEELEAPADETSFDGNITSPERPKRVRKRV